MQITKIGHCCLVIEVKGVRVMTDPGAFSFGVEDADAVDAIVITHEHADHLHVDFVERVLRRSPHAIVLSNSSVAAILAEKGIGATVLEGEAAHEVKGITIQAFDAKHEEIFEDIGQVQNTGYLIDAFYYPGDAFSNPGKPIDVLALPVVGPWCRMKDALAYAISLKPQSVVPVHDGIMREEAVGIVHNAPGLVLPKHGIAFRPLKAGQSIDF